MCLSWFPEVGSEIHGLTLFSCLLRCWGVWKEPVFCQIEKSMVKSVSQDDALWESVTGFCSRLWWRDCQTALKNKSDPRGSVYKGKMPKRRTPEFLSRFPLEPTCRCIANENKRRQSDEEEGGCHYDNRFLDACELVCLSALGVWNPHACFVFSVEGLHSTWNSSTLLSCR